MGRQSRLKEVRRHTRNGSAPPREQLPPWTPFQRQHINPLAPDTLAALNATVEVAQRTGHSPEQVLRTFVQTVNKDLIFVNSRYQVNVRRVGSVGPDVPPMVHLSIKRLDKLAPGPERYRDFQRIKNELVGPECEGAELYPAESRLVDGSNQYHIFCLATPGHRFPFGFEGRHVSYDAVPGSVQQRFSQEL